MPSENLFDVLKKRRACRNFNPTRVPDEILNKIVYAAHRAPTGGNIPFRFLILVKDPRQLKLLKMVSPGFLGEASAALVICTDLNVAQRNGKIVDDAAHIDAGAAAENAVLAAYALGLAGSFIKSYSEAAVKRVLDIPEGYRTELIVSLGYPANDEPHPLKKPKQGLITYVNKFGELAAA